MTWFFISNQLLLFSLTDLVAHTWFLLNTPGFPLFMCKQSPQFCVINIHSTPTGRAVASNSCWDTDFFFFCLFSASQIHRMTTQDCFEVSIFTPPQITTKKQILAEYKNSPDKTKQPVHQHEKNGCFFSQTENELQIYFYKDGASCTSKKQDTNKNLIFY